MLQLINFKFNRYFSLQLGQKLWDHSLKEAYRRGCKWGEAICTALGSTKIALNVF